MAGRQRVRARRPQSYLAQVERCQGDTQNVAQLGTRSLSGALESLNCGRRWWCSKWNGQARSGPSISGRRLLLGARDVSLTGIGSRLPALGHTLAGRADLHFHSGLCVCVCVDLHFHLALDGDSSMSLLLLLLRCCCCRACRAAARTILAASQSTTLSINYVASLTLSNCANVCPRDCPAHRVAIAIEAL